MKRLLSFAAIVLTVAALTGCKKSAPEAAAPTAKVITPADLSAMANAVPNTGPREGNNYKVFYLTLKGNQGPAVGFRVDAWVKGKSEPVTKTTDASGLVTFEDLPYPDSKHPLMTVLHYFTAPGRDDEAREITYPFIETDAYRLKDTQYIPATSTPDLQP